MEATLSGNTGKSLKEFLKEYLENMSFEEVETCELNKMKYNAFKVCEEVSHRVDGGVAPGGYIKAWVTPDEDSLFFWDQKRLHHYLANKDNQSEVSIPGENYYRKVENFMKNHFVMGEKYSEFLKFSCQETCNFLINMAGMMKFVNEFQSHFLITLVKINSNICMCL